MKSINHSKYKNPMILFELLTRQITVDLLNEASTSPAIKILKNYFGSDTELKKEHALYKTLIDENFRSRDRAEELLNEVVKRRKKLNEKKLYNQKYNLVGKIKENYSLDDFFQSRIDKYKEYASIYKIFEYKTSEGDYDPADAVRSKDTILEHITEGGSEENKEFKRAKDEILQGFESKPKDMRMLTQKLMIEKFNEKYESLLSEQKELLKKYINNISNTNSLRDYVNEEVERIKSELKDLVPSINEESTRIKVTETLKLIDGLKSGNHVRDDQVSSLMMYYQLLDEVKSTI